MTQLWRIGLLCCALFATLNGCDVPKAYQVANVVNPQDEDVDVRFRTTYYIRVFDLCLVEEGRKGKDDKNDHYKEGMAALVHRIQGHYRITKDSLYRFRMTGQSQAFFNNIRFESGTVRDYEIDPFGTTIDLDKKPPAQSSETAKQGATDNGCPQGEVKDTKFYLLGPEGVKELKHSERLVMAMSTDAKPLISALQRIGGIKANVEAEAAAQYRVKLNQARVASALEKLNAQKGKMEKEGMDAQSSPEALEATILGLFKNEVGGQ